MLHISDAEKSTQENRVLATKPSLFVDGKINQKYGVQFNSWFNDRFFGRDILVDMNTLLKYNLSHRLMMRGHCINKRTKWLGGCPHVYKMFSKSELNKMVNSLEKLKIFTDKNNIKFYILIAPSQGSVYGQNIMPNYKNKNEIERIYQAISYIKEHTNIDIVFPYNEIMDAAKDDYVFFRTDTHWTDVGAFIGYKKVLNDVKKDFKRIKILTEDDFDYIYSNMVKVQQTNGFHKGRNYSLVGLHDNSFFNSDYKYFVHKKSYKLEVSRESHPRENYHITQLHFDDGKYNLAIFGDSFTENLEPTMPYSFKNTLKIYTYVPSNDLLAKNLNFQRFEKQVLKNKTDAIIIVFSAIDRLMYLY